MRDLRDGVMLKKVQERQYNPLPIEYQLTPYEMLMDDIRSKRYQLRKVMVSTVCNRINCLTVTAVRSWFRTAVHVSGERRHPTPVKEKRPWDHPGVHQITAAPQPREYLLPSFSGEFSLSPKKGFARSQRLSPVTARSRLVSWNPTRRVHRAFMSDCWRTLKPRGSWGLSHRTWFAGAAWVRAEVLMLYWQYYQGRNLISCVYTLWSRALQSSKTTNVLSFNHILQNYPNSPLPALIQSRKSVIMFEQGLLSEQLPVLSYLPQHMQLNSTNEWSVVTQEAVDLSEAPQW